MLTDDAGRQSTDEIQRTTVIWLRRERDEARRVARRCWHGWRLYADMDGPPGVSPASREAVSVGEQFPWLKDKDER